MKKIHKAAVLGAGTMGSRIAAHLANAGIPCFLFDIVPAGATGSDRDQIAVQGLAAARKAKSAAFFESSLSSFVTPGNFDDDLDRLAEVDWIIEAIVEDLDAKRSLLKRVEAVRKPGTIVTTNTSGLPVAQIADGFSQEFRRSWFGTHFFNPPRYMRLLEIIPTAETDPAVIEAISQFADLRLGKGVVMAKDTPNFIANRIGTFSVLNVMRVMQKLDLTIEEVDALTGPTIGWPRSATFRTLDMVGLDILAHVVRNMEKQALADPDTSLPPFVVKMLEGKMLGDKVGGGFYKKAAGAPGGGLPGGQSEILALDWKTLDYRPRQKPKFASLEIARNIDDPPQRLRMLLRGSGKGKDEQFLWQTLSDLWNYAADCVPEISDDIVAVDRAMRLGFNWELGPFELWDAAGVEDPVARMKKEGRTLPANVEKLLLSGKKSWYEDDPRYPSGRVFFDFETGDYLAAKLPAGEWSVAAAKKSKGVVKKNSGASLIDIGDGIGCIEFHSKMNTIGTDIVQLVSQTLKSGGPGDSFEAFVITNDAVNFSVGANLMLLLMSAQDEEWDDIDLAIRQFQGMTQALKFSPKPVVLAPFGMTLGGGVEMSLHAAARQPHAELYMGLVEVGVGLLPGGGGCKEMLLRAMEAASSARSDSRGESIELIEAMRRTFEVIDMAKVSGSAVEARSLGFLTATDSITMNRGRVLSDAKGRALELIKQGYQPPPMRTDIVAPGENVIALLKLGIHLMREGEYITDYEVKIGTKVAEVLCGGAVTPGTLVSEQYFLDLEREAFKSLCGERKTQERIQYTLKTGKTLRN